MSGNARNADGEVPNLDDGEAEGESTVAMEAPSFELPSNVPLPITNPPPAPGSDPKPSPAIPKPPGAPMGAPPSVPKPTPKVPPVAAKPIPPIVGPPTPHKPIVVPPPPQRAVSSARMPAAPPASPADNEAPTRMAQSPVDPPKDPEAATVAVPKGVVDSVRRSRGREEEETTRAVPREELLRQQDAHVVVGDDAIGDEATVAVMAGANSAAAIPAGFMETLGASPSQPEQPAFPAPPQRGPGTAGAVAQGAPRPHLPTAMGMGPPAQPPPWSPPQQQHQPQHQGPSSMGPVPGQRISNPGLPPYSSGGMMAAPPHSQPYPQQPMHGGMMGPHGTHPQMGGPAGQHQGQPSMMGGPIPWQPGPPEPRPNPIQTLFAQVSAQLSARKISGQMILLVAVGAVCLAIFITGIVLFVTTKI